MRQIASAILLLGLAACATPEPPLTEPATTPAPPSTALQDAVKMDAVKPEQLPPAAKAAATARPGSATAARRTNPRNLKPMPTRPLEVSMNCRFRNETGYNGEARVEVRDGAVRRLHVEYNLPGRGSCQMVFDPDHQTRRLPSVELRHASTGCTARMWEQGDQATVSFTGCAAHCTNAEAFQYVWPVLMNRRSGRCD
ncbi:hypothetical protein [Uliginosibacterium sp. H1]|uniref:hypothetical protein n=1 Tax=Uliginosibacterium sp. H1 TaxID=3114757 RepID=UPI002E17D27B|nr:hypothetical protein [Uliginosibacterium sp. H1]